MNIDLRLHLFIDGVLAGSELLLFVVVVDVETLGWAGGTGGGSLVPLVKEAEEVVGL